MNELLSRRYLFAMIRRYLCVKMIINSQNLETHSFHAAQTTKYKLNSIDSWLIQCIQSDKLT